jgi:hypothetical protein
VVFLSVIRLSNIKVATILLSMAFLYDIFFVFISPYFFQESIMVKVATGNLVRMAMRRLCSSSSSFPYFSSPWASEIYPRVFARCTVFLSSLNAADSRP